MLRNQKLVLDSELGWGAAWRAGKGFQSECPLGSGPVKLDQGKLAKKSVV